MQIITSNTSCFEEEILNYLKSEDINQNDSSHDIGHFKRVWAIAKKIIQEEEDYSNDKNQINYLVVMAACYLHDLVTFPKNDPRRHESSKHAAEAAELLLKKIKFPNDLISATKHAIIAHSFSANITPETIEAKIVQDADRMEALGAIGIARCFAIAGKLNSKLFHSEDPLATERELDDKLYGLDHFQVKLLKLPATMQTKSGKRIAEARADFLKRFMIQIENEQSATI